MKINCLDAKELLAKIQAEDRLFAERSANIGVMAAIGQRRDHALLWANAEKCEIPSIGFLKAVAEATS